MNICKLAAACAVILSSSLSAGCLVLFLHPAYDDATIVFDEALLGVWGNEEDKAMVTIARGEWRSYDIAYKDNTDHAELSGYLTTIGGERFIDIVRRRGVDYGPYLVPVHGVYRIVVTGDTLTTSAFNYDWAEQAVNRRSLGKVQAALDDRDNVLVTSNTAELRKWIASKLKQPEAFAPPATFQREK